MAQANLVREEEAANQICPLMSGNDQRRCAGKKCMAWTWSSVKMSGGRDSDINKPTGFCGMVHRVAEVDDYL